MPFGGEAFRLVKQAFGCLRLVETAEDLCHAKQRSHFFGPGTDRSRHRERILRQAPRLFDSAVVVCEEGELAKDAGSQGARWIGRNEIGGLVDHGRASDLVVVEHFPSRALEE